MFPASQKASGGISICFPDVCKTPTPNVGLVPLPYPTVAKTAAAIQKKTAAKTASKTVARKSSSFSSSWGEEAGTRKGLVSSKNTETAQLKSAINQLNTRIQTLNSKNPNEWQKVIQDYVVAVSALYVTRNS